MRYERKREEGTAVFYEVLEQGRKAAEFFYAVKPCQTGRGNCQFWIERIHMEQDYLDYSYLDTVLHVYTDQCCEFDGYGTLSALRILCDSRADVRTETGEFCLPLCSKIPIAQRMGRDNEYKGEKYLL